MALHLYITFIIDKLIYKKYFISSINTIKFYSTYTLILGHIVFWVKFPFKNKKSAVSQLPEQTRPV